MTSISQVIHAVLTNTYRQWRHCCKLDLDPVLAYDKLARIFFCFFFVSPVQTILFNSVLKFRIIPSKFIGCCKEYQVRIIHKCRRFKASSLSQFCFANIIFRQATEALNAEHCAKPKFLVPRSHDCTRKWWLGYGTCSLGILMSTF